MCINKQVASFYDLKTYTYSPYGNSNSVSEPEKEDVLFPGVLDRGSPLIINENGRNTVYGIFQEHLNEDSAKGPALYSQLNPDSVNWIMNFADWTQDSACNVFTSCLCGTRGGWEFNYDAWM